MKQLDEYPSVAIIQAIEDIEWVEKSEDHHVDMGNWYRTMDTHCTVCQAGAVALRRHPEALVRCDYNYLQRIIRHSDFILEDKIQAFDCLRLGFFDTFLDAWIEAPKKELKRLEVLISNGVGTWVEYEEDQEQYKKNLRKVARILDKEGY
jgi:hypothetical protein